MKYFKLNGITCECGNDSFLFMHMGIHVGAYCSKCGKWVKWLNKNEKNIANLFFEQFK